MTGKLSLRDELAEAIGRSLGWSNTETDANASGVADACLAVMARREAWQPSSVKPAHKQDILIETEVGSVLVGFYISPHESKSMLTGFCYWPGRSSHAVGLLCQRWRDLPKPPTTKA